MLAWKQQSSKEWDETTLINQFKLEFNVVR